MRIQLGDPQDPLPTALTALGALVLAGTLLYVVLVPAPTTRGLVARARTKEREIQNKVADAKGRETEIGAVLAKRKTPLPPDAIASSTLARVTLFASKGGLRLTAFRPQRTTDSPTGVTLYPYQITVEGPFPAVAKFVRALETETTDLAVTLLQLATSSEGDAGRVNATVGVVAFRDTPKRPARRPAAPPSPSPGTATPATATPAPDAPPTNASATNAPPTNAPGATNGPA